MHFITSYLLQTQLLIINELTSKVKLNKSHRRLVKYLNNTHTSCLFIVQIKLFKRHMFEYLLKHTQWIWRQIIG